jgi:hypothetical protein
MVFEVHYQTVEQRLDSAIEKRQHKIVVVYVPLVSKKEYPLLLDPLLMWLTLVDFVYDVNSKYYDVTNTLQL